MSLYGGLAENTRRNLRIEFGTSIVNPGGGGTGQLVVTVNPPMRKILFVMGQCRVSVATGAVDATLVPGTGTSSNTFTIYLWEVDGTAADEQVTVDWLAVGNLTGGGLGSPNF